MRRSPIVLSATAAGLAGVLAFHTHPQTLAAVPATSRSAGTTATPVAKAAPAASTGTRTGTGVDVPNQYGDVQVKVTVTGTKITAVTAVALPQSDGRSQMISQQAEPILRSQALAAQSAQIDGVSGASYTSDGYRQSLQSALDKLGVRG
ncbi:MAG: hypothetical protein JWO74_1371 [Solirubrobacterales bacterium]|jgi:uncharacterized protein with FMN-binding domain|nr:hypothetical protein [Solirubrobacterales bacterium]